jgi:anti-sigma factor RsiW
VADYEARPGRLRQSHAGIQPRPVTNVKSYGSFHVTTLRFPPQIIKGGPTSKHVEVILPNMWSLSCAVVRFRLERHADGALGARGARLVTTHLAGCPACRAASEKWVLLRALVRQAVSVPADPDWLGFWPPVRSRILSEDPRPLRESWWVPFWKPVWGHPRLAFGAALLAVLVVTFSFWPVDDAAFASQVNVQDVSADDPDRSVMVYTSRDPRVTVIWVFGSSEGHEAEGDDADGDVP